MTEVAARRGRRVKVGKTNSTEGSVAKVNVKRHPRNDLADILYRETGGLYPTGEGRVYDRSYWDADSLKNLQEARSTIVALHQAHPEQSMRRGWPKAKDAPGWSAYDLCRDAAATASTTDISEATNLWIGQDEAPFGAFGANTKSQEVVVKFGPFRNVGGGDAKGSEVYIWFHKVVAKVVAK